MRLCVTLEKNHSVHVLYLELYVILFVLLLISNVLVLAIVLGIKYLYLYLYLTYVVSTFTCTCTWGFMKVHVLDTSTIISTWPQTCNVPPIIPTTVQYRICWGKQQTLSLHNNLPAWPCMSPVYNPKHTRFSPYIGLLTSHSRETQRKWAIIDVR